MNQELYVDILESSLLPFIREVFPPNGHKLMQDNDPKHASNFARVWMARNGVNWWKTPPESPDLNPIENLWHKLKEFIRREVKPTTKEELMDGIRKFWQSVDVAKCSKYINHLYKVMPKVIEVDGQATGY